MQTWMFPVPDVCIRTYGRTDGRFLSGTNTDGGCDALFPLVLKLSIHSAAYRCLLLLAVTVSESPRGSGNQ